MKATYTTTAKQTTKTIAGQTFTLTLSDNGTMFWLGNGGAHPLTVADEAALAAQGVAINQDADFNPLALRDANDYEDQADADGYKSCDDAYEGDAYLPF